MSHARISLKQKKEESLLRFHPWVFSGAIASIEGAPQEGALVEVYSSDNRWLGIGHYQIGTIAVRILSFLPTPIDETFWRERIETAYELRKQLGLAEVPDNDTYRLIFGEGDGLPGLIIDIYGNTAVIQAHSVGMHHAREMIATTIQQVMEGTIKNIFYKSETTLPYKADIEHENEFLLGGHHPEDFEVHEKGLRFHVDWMKGQKTGFFVDQRDNRLLLEQYAKNRSVLNMFCYTGGFSVYAMRGGAKIVHSVDSSSKAIHLTKNNVALNFPDDPRHEAFDKEAFQYLQQMEEHYDLIILDPPAFAKHRNVLRNALQGYRKLNAIAMKKIAPGGIIFTFSCSQIVSRNDFRLAVFSAAAQSGREVRILHQLSQPADHPINIYHPEGEYLKGLVLQVK